MEFVEEFIKFFCSKKQECVYKKKKQKLNKFIVFTCVFSLWWNETSFNFSIFASIFRILLKVQPYKFRIVLI